MLRTRFYRLVYHDHLDLWYWVDVLTNTRAVGFYETEHDAREAFADGIEWEGKHNG